MGLSFFKLLAVQSTANAQKPELGGAGHVNALHGWDRSSLGGQRAYYHFYEKQWIACPEQKLCTVSKSKKKNSKGDMD